MRTKEILVPSKRMKVDRLEELNISQEGFAKRKSKKSAHPSSEFAFAVNSNLSCRYDASLAIVVSVFANVVDEKVSARLFVLFVLLI